MIRNRTHNRPAAILLAAVATLVGALCLAGSAAAQTVYDWEYDGTTFNSSDAVPAEGAAPNRYGNLFIDQGNDVLYGAYRDTEERTGKNRIYKYNFAGQSTPWAAYAPNTWLQKPNMRSYFAVDNSGDPETQGRIYYVDNTFTPQIVKAMLPNGEDYEGGNFPYTPAEGNMCGIAVDPEGDIWITHFNGFASFGAAGSPQGYLEELDPEGFPTGQRVYAEAFTFGFPSEMCDVEIDGNGNFYTTGMWVTPDDPGGREHGGVYRFSPDGTKHRGPIDASEGWGSNFVRFPITVDRSTNEFFTAVEDTVRVYDEEGGLTPFTFGGPEGAFTGGIDLPSGMAIDEDTHNVYVSQEGGRVDRFKRVNPTTVPDVRTSKPEPTPTTAVIRGTIDPDGLTTTDCYFEWGNTIPRNGNPLPNTADCKEGDVYTGNTTQPVTAEIGGLSLGTEYYARLVSHDASNVLSRGIMYSFRASSPPTVTGVNASGIDTGGAILSANLALNGSQARFRFEWGTEAGNYTDSAPVKPKDFDYKWNRSAPKLWQQTLTGLDSETTYHFRFVAENDAGVTASPDQTFRTFAKDPEGDACDNAHVRQQTSTRLLLDCRAYELVSARYAGGYNVDSDLGPGEFPLMSPSNATDRVLYSYHFGSVPGIAGSPTTFGHDPYVAVRGANGWETKYAGLPADGMADPSPYGSPLLGTDSQLTTFVFGGQDICDPCFSDGSINIPLRRANDTIEKGIPGGPNANPSGSIAKYLSADGTHLVFGSNEILATGGSSSGSIYERNLSTTAVELVSTLPNGTAIPGGDAVELDVSDDGSRVLIATPEGTDSHGNTYWHLYQHVAGTANSVDLTPGASAGALFAGMSADGTRVFYATHDKLLVGQDTDESADIYEALVTGTGPAALSLVSSENGTPVNDDSCNAADEWNAVGDLTNCSALPFAGGGGVSENGTIYFFSPDRLGGGGNGEEADQPNLYRYRAGESLEYVTTPDTSVGKPPPPPPARPLLNATHVTALSAPESVAVDPATRNLYVLETAAGRISRYNSSGAPVNFSAGPNPGTNRISGLSLINSGRRQVAIDDSSSPFDGAIYVNDGGNKVSIFAQNGEKLGELDGSTSPFGSFGNAACGVTVDQNGVVYVGDSQFGFGIIFRFVPSGSAPITSADYGAPTFAILNPNAAGNSPCHLAADSLGNVYFGQQNGSAGKVTQADFASTFTFVTATYITPSGRSVAVDRSTDELYIDDGSQIKIYAPGGGSQITSYGLGDLSNSRGIAVDPTDHNSYASSGSSVRKFGYVIPTNTNINYPPVLNALKQPLVRDPRDIQITPDGKFAAFSATRPLTGYPVNGHNILYRFASGGGLDCVSCPVSEINASADTSLPRYGLGLTDDGRVFFDTTEQLVLRDTNGKRDVYEWRKNEKETARQQQLISTGSSRTDTSLLTTTNDGVDAFFFTTEVLVPEDENGGAVKLYDAREHGGIPFLPARVPCQAADECRGPGTEQPAPPNINTFTGGGRGRGNAQGGKAKTCRKGFVKRKNKKTGKVRCVKKKRKAKRNRGSRNG